MTNFNSSKVEELHNLLKNKVEKFRISEIKPDETEIMKFCDLIGENNSIFLDDSPAIKAGFEGKLVHPGYLMSLTNPIVQLILIKEGADLFSNLAKAFIHVGSEVEFFKPLLMNKKYKIKVDLSEPIEKKGKKGVYCSIIFKFSVLDENNDIYAIDNHICFFRF
ncbi:MAG: MaoC family dehydratase [Promethearchaeota archaeon]